MKPLFFASSRLTPSALTKALIGFIALVCISLVSATAWQVSQSKTERIATSKLVVSSIVLAAELQVQSTLQQTDIVLRQLSERVKHDGVGSEQRSRLTNVMAEEALKVEGIQGLFLYDAQGNWIASSFSQDLHEKNIGDSVNFVRHRDVPDDALHIGSAIESRVIDDKVIPISLRLNSANGTFGGVAIATVSVAYFQAFFERMEVDAKGVIFLARDDGELLARRPRLTGSVATNISKGDIFSRYLPHHDSGTAVLTSVVDKVERIYAYRRLAGLPLVAAAGVSYEHVLAPWWAYAYRSFSVVGMIVLFLTFMGILLYRQVRQMIIAERQLSTARNELEVIAQTDSLTLLANRRCFDTALLKEWGRASRNRSQIAIILLDIDWFKQLNDAYGHLQGDECLKHIAQLINFNVNRAGDLAARFGGEEFVILLPDTDLAGAISVAEKIRLSICEALIDHSASPSGIVTISAGVVAINVPEKDGHANALAEVDRLLYRAKSKGRNRVEGGAFPPRMCTQNLVDILPEAPTGL